MKQFDILEFQKNIEEKRLILAKKLEKFLLKKVMQISSFFGKIFTAKSCAFFGCLLIISISILVRSTRDIGHDSAVCLEITKKLLNGGKYYQDFFENNLPLFFYFNSIPYFLAKIFALNPIIASEITSNLIGILALYFAAKILVRSSIYKDRTIFNLIILSFACGFFLRVFTLQFNEFGTKSTYFLVLIFLYVSYHLIEESALKKIDQIIIGIFAALFFCLKPHYGILPIVFEVKKMLEKKSFIGVFCLRNYVTATLLILYLLFMFARFPDYIEALPKFAEIYYSGGHSLTTILKQDLFPILTFTFLNVFLLKKFNFLVPFFLTNLAISLVVLSELIGGQDQRFVLYSAALPSLSLVMFLMIKNRYIDWKKDGLFLSMILFVLQFDSQSFFNIIFNLGIFWWILVLFLSRKWRAVFKEKKLIDDSFLSQIFVPRDMKSWFCFSGLAALIFLLLFIKGANDLAWFLSTIVLISLINFNQKLDEKFFITKKFSTILVATIFVVVAYFFSSVVGESNYKSPNHSNDQIIKNSKNYTFNEDEILIISSPIFGAYPAISYLEKENRTPILNSDPLYSEIEKSRKSFNEMSAGKKYLLSRIKQQITSKKNKLIFIEKKDIFSKGQCQVGFLEYYFRDQEFKKIFLENYIFLNRIITLKKSESRVEFFNDDWQMPENSDNKQKSKIIENDIEVYVRKNN